MPPRISIITVCYNEEKSIHITLDSVLKQRSMNFEYIIKDGLSTDKTNDIVEDYKDKFKEKGVCFKHLSCKDLGIYDAMNKASDYCSGDYILFLNAGDYLFNETVLEVVEKKMNFSAKDVYCGHAIVSDILGKALFKADLSLFEKRMPFVHQASFIKRKLFLRYKYNLKYKICADYNLFLTLFQEGKSFEVIDTIICVYDAMGISSTAFISKRKEHEEILFSHGLNCKSKYFKNMLEAYIKEFINKLPSKITSRLKNWYKWNVKHYIKIRD